MALFSLIAYLAVQYIQPGIKSPALGALRPALVFGVLLALATALKLAQSKQGIVFPRPSKLFLGFLVLMTVSVAQAENKWNASWVWLLVVTQFAVYFCMTQVVDTKGKLKALVYAFVVINVWIGIEGVRFFYSPVGKIEGAKGLAGVLQNFLGNTNDYALAMVVILPFAYALLAQTQSFVAKAGCLGAVLLFAAAIMSTFSRGGQLGLAAILMTPAVKSERKLSAVLVLISVGILVTLIAPQQYWGRVGSIGDVEDSSARNRLYTWRAGLEMGLKNPLLGVGPGSFVTAYRRGGYRESRPEGVGKTLFTAHSVYFQLVAELGLSGLWLFFALVRDNLRTCNSVLQRAAPGESIDPANQIITIVAAACRVSLIGFLVSGAFLSAAYYPHFWYLTGFIVVIDKLARESASTFATQPVVARRGIIAPVRART